jgi:flavin reductase (DIM6/NTAB) family NADH-FMN oxidoreductase RutF
MPDRSHGTAAFEDLVSHLDYPMLVVTAATAEDPAVRSGCLVGFSSQCSMQPPLYMVWISKLNHTHRVAQRALHLGVHVLGGEDRGLAELFGEETGDQIDKFTRCRWRQGPNGVPLLSDCRRWFCGRIIERQMTGDHTGFLLEPTQGLSDKRPFQPLTFQQVRDMHPGHPA